MVDMKKKATDILEDYSNSYSQVDLEILTKFLEQIKSEAYKEFAEKIKKHSRKMQSSDFSGDFWDAAVLVEDIDKLVEEMLGE